MGFSQLGLDFNRSIEFGPGADALRVSATTYCRCRWPRMCLRGYRTRWPPTWQRIRLRP